jgi:hypothetical protein
MGLTQRDRLVDLMPPPRKHRHGYHGVFAPNNKIRRAVMSLTTANMRKHRDAVTS